MVGGAGRVMAWEGGSEQMLLLDEMGACAWCKQEQANCLARTCAWHTREGNNDAVLKEILHGCARCASQHHHHYDPAGVWAGTPPLVQAHNKRKHTYDKTTSSAVNNT